MSWVSGMLSADYCNRCQKQFLFLCTTCKAFGSVFWMKAVLKGGDKKKKDLNFREVLNNKESTEKVLCSSQT